MIISADKLREDWDDICNFISEKGYAHEAVVETQFKSLCACSVDEDEALLIVRSIPRTDVVDYLINKNYDQVILQGINEYYETAVTKQVRFIDIDDIEDFGAYPGMEKDKKFLDLVRSRNIINGIKSYDHGAFIREDCPAFNYCMERISKKYSYKPIFIRGDVGVGKTHFLKALAGECIDTLPTKRVLYLTMEEYINDLLDSLENGNIAEFANNLVTKNDLILIDYTEDIRCRRETKKEFLKLLSDAEWASTQVVMTSTIRAEKIFSDIGYDTSVWGKMLEIVLPNHEVLHKIAKTKLERMGMDYNAIPRNDIDVIIENVKNIRELEAALHVYKFDNSYREGAFEIDERIIKSDSVLRIKNISPSPDEVIRAVADSLDTKYEELTSKNGCNHIYKEICAYLLYECTSSGITAIGELLGGYSYDDIALMLHDMYQQLEYNGNIYSIMKNVAERLA